MKNALPWISAVAALLILGYLTYEFFEDRKALQDADDTAE